MKTPLKSSLAALSVAILTVITITGCKSYGDGSPSGVHTMGSQKSGYMMSDKTMPGR